MYLDSAASARHMNQHAVVRMREVIASGLLGNPSSAHREGQRSRRILREAREEVALALGADPDEVVFTSGVTESLFLAVHGLSRGRTRVAISAYEHASTYAAVQGLDLETFTLSANGSLTRTLDVGLVCASIVNHETGLLLDVAALCGAAPNALLVLDAAQAAEHVKSAWALPQVSAIALSGHKLGGPSGMGVLLVRKGAPFASRIGGGHQEHGLRAGTESVVAAAGLARALSHHPPASRLANDAFEARLIATVHGASVVAHDRARAGNITAARILGVSGRALAERANDAGLALSYGAACASQSQEPSNVMKALGLSRERGLEVFRVSFSSDASADEGVAAADALATLARALRGEDATDAA
jgi:cysteine desulfurase